MNLGRCRIGPPPSRVTLAGRRSAVLTAACAFYAPRRRVLRYDAARPNRPYNPAPRHPPYHNTPNPPSGAARQRGGATSNLHTPQQAIISATFRRFSTPQPPLTPTVLNPNSSPISKHSLTKNTNLTQHSQSSHPIFEPNQHTNFPPKIVSHTRQNPIQGGIWGIIALINRGIPPKTFRRHVTTHLQHGCRTPGLVSHHLRYGAMAADLSVINELVCLITPIMGNRMCVLPDRPAQAQAHPQPCQICGDRTMARSSADHPG